MAGFSCAESQYVKMSKACFSQCMAVLCAELHCVETQRLLCKPYKCVAGFS